MSAPSLSPRPKPALSRRGFVGLVAALACPPVARARENAIRVVGILISLRLDDTASSRLSAFKASLAKLGWIEGQTVRYEVRSTFGSPAVRPAAAAEMIALKPDVLVASSSPETGALLAATKTIPIVFATAADPVGSGFVESLARPGGNATGFTNSHAAMGTKWLQFLKEIDPRITRISVLFNPQSTARGGRYFLEPIEAAAATLGATVAMAEITDPSAIESAVEGISGAPPGGLILLPDSFTVAHRQAVVAAAARYRVPTIYPLRYFADAGGLISYGAAVEVNGAEYVDMILRGAKPADLPVQSPRRYELLINLKAAQALGLTVPLALIARADQVIE